MSVKTRFAPSPTGYLHIGGVRTALFSWLYAKKNNGQFVLRIEDTDRERSTDESVQVILEGMKWLGLDWDEGPIYQTQRFDRYAEVIQQLVDQGDAYPCYCSRERLDQLRETQMANKEKPRYDGCCRDTTAPAPEGVSPVIRFKNPTSGEVVIDDQIKGKITIRNEELDDLIIARSDGTPTYNLTVVVDDWEMGITHVVRGDDHINNTPRQINILKALGAPIPVYAHAAMILGADGSRLSKRHGAVNVLQYRDEGYLPQAVLNYLVRLGWSHGDQEIFSLNEMQELFALDAVNNAASTFNPEKLLWLNQQYIKSEPAKVIAEALTPILQAKGADLASGPALEDLIDAHRERAKTLVDMADACLFFYKDFDEYNAKAAKKAFGGAAAEVLSTLHDKYAELADWAPETIHGVIDDVCAQYEVGMGKVGMPLRVAVAGSGQSPAIDLTLSLLGKPKTLARINRAIAHIGE